MKNIFKKYNPWTHGSLILIITVCVVYIISNTPTNGPAYEYSVKMAGQHPQTNTTQTASQSTSYVIYYTNSGFSPKATQVPKGHLVKFVNNSSRALLILLDNKNAATPSDIEQSKSLGQGQSYSVNVTHTGVWLFHNADYPSDHANLVVY